MPTSTLTEGSAGRHLLDVWEAKPLADRSEWLRAAKSPARRQLLAAAKVELGTPYGLWADDPIGFVTDVLGETLWGRQREIMLSVRDYEQTAVPSSFSSGKTHLAGRIVAWWGAVHPPGSAIAICTASRMRQVTTQVWPHVKRVVNDHGLPGIVQESQWMVPTDSGRLERVAWGFTAPRGESEAVQGGHAPHVLVIVDEAGLVNPITGQAWLSASTGAHTRIVAFGNPPVDQEDSWLEVISGSTTWNTVSISAEDTPNFTGEHVDPCRACPDWRKRPHTFAEHLISPRDVSNMAVAYGTDSAWYISKVLARFAKGQANKTVPAGLVTAGRLGTKDGADLDKRTLTPAGSRVRLGVDLAQGGGDELVVALSVGRLARVVRTQRGEANVNTFAVAGYIKEEIEKAALLRKALGSTEPLDVMLDGTNDRGPIDTLQAWNAEGLLGPAVHIVGVNFGEAADARDRFANRRAEMHWNVRTQLTADETGYQDLYLDIDDKAAGQLSDPKYHTNLSGKLVLESKDDLLKRGRPSPDRADALALARYDPPSLRFRRRRGIIAESGPPPERGGWG